jgi:hypothetical protein
MVRGKGMMADGEILSQPGHRRYQTRHIERDADRGRIAR